MNLNKTRIMKKILNIILLGTIIVILTAKVSNWFFDFSEPTNDIINTTMFCLIGVAYLYWSINQSNQVYKVFVSACGVYIIVMNFIERSSLMTIIGIVCVLAPMIIFRLDGKSKKETQ